jgi:hypothetical protein
MGKYTYTLHGTPSTSTRSSPRGRRSTRKLKLLRFPEKVLVFDDGGTFRTAVD